MSPQGRPGGSRPGQRGEAADGSGAGGFPPRRPRPRERLPPGTGSGRSGGSGSPPSTPRRNRSGDARPGPRPVPVSCPRTHACGKRGLSLLKARVKRAAGCQRVSAPLIPFPLLSFSRVLNLFFPLHLCTIRSPHPVLTLNQLFTAWAASSLLCHNENFSTSRPQEVH